MQMYVLALMQGVNRVVQSGNTPRAPTAAIPSSPTRNWTLKFALLRNIGAAAVGAIAGEVVTAKFVNKVTDAATLWAAAQRDSVRAQWASWAKMPSAFLKAFRTGGHINRLVGTAIVGGAAAVLDGPRRGRILLGQAVALG